MFLTHNNPKTEKEKTGYTLLQTGTTQPTLLLCWLLQSNSECTAQLPAEPLSLQAEPGTLPSSLLNDSPQYPTECTYFFQPSALALAPSLLNNISVISLLETRNKDQL